MVTPLVLCTGLQDDALFTHTFNLKKKNEKNCHFKAFILQIQVQLY